MPTWYCADCLSSFTVDVPRCPNLACGAERPSSGWGAVLEPGAHLDRNYLIERVLAHGGAGITYLAREVGSDGEPVEPWLAVKVLFARRDRGGFLRRLATEAQILQELDHPHIVQLYGFVHRRGHAPYLVTRFEGGGTLYDAVRERGPMPPVVALQVLRQILQALEVAHRRGVVHRDLKPQNVLLEAPPLDGVPPRVRVADFGIAKVSGTLGEGVTQVGSFVGTPEYAAPEQFSGVTAAPPADVFAAGGLLHFLVTGRHPVRFTDRRDVGRCFEELLDALPPRLDGYTGGGIAGLQALLEGAMRAVAHQRWTTAELRAQVDALLASDLDALLASDLDADVVVTPPVEPSLGGTLVVGAGPASETLVVPLDHASTLPPAPPREPELPEVAAEVVSEPSRAIAASSPSTELSLDDLFDFGLTSPAPEPVRPSTPTAPPVDPFELGDPFEPAPTDSFEPAPPPPAPTHRGGLVLFADGTLWEPTRPQHLEGALPGDPGAILELLGKVAVADRAVVLRVLGRHEAGSIGRALRRSVRGSKASRCGSALAIAGLGMTREASGARSLLIDRDADVRVCACHALGAVGGGGLLASLSRLLDDREPRVRAAAVLALRRAAARTGAHGRVRGWLRRVQGDPDPRVAEALEV